METVVERTLGETVPSVDDGRAVFAWPPVADVPLPGTDRIFLRGLRVDALIGVYPHERLRPQPLLVDIELRLAHSRACYSDELADAVDYGEVVQQVRRLAAANRCLLLEAFAQQVADALLASCPATAVTMTVCKPGIFAEADAVGVTIHRERRQFMTGRAQGATS